MTLLHNSVWLETPWHLRIREMMAHVQFLNVRVLERLGNDDESKIFLLLSFLEFRAREIGETTIKQVVLLRIRLCFLSGKTTLDIHWFDATECHKPYCSQYDPGLFKMQPFHHLIYFLLLTDSVEDELEMATVCHRPEGLEQLEAQTKFTKKELQILYRGFKNVSKYNNWN